MIKMRNEPGAGAQFFERTTAVAPLHPPAYLEYIWYINLAYAILGKALNIIIPSVGGAIWLVLAATCVLSVGVQNLRVYKPVAWALGSGVLVVSIQLLFHEQSSMAVHEVIDCIAWMAMLITAQALALRPGFLQRFGLVAFAIGLAVVPFIQVRSSGNVMRAWASGTGIGNPNGLGMWFGFCTVYFVFLGFHSQKLILRTVFWTVAVGCLFMVLLSVSRGPLLAILLACIAGLSSVLKRGYVALLSLALLLYFVYLSGVFDDWVDFYFSRGTEETGRGLLWSVGVERFLDAPWIGYGLGDIKVSKGGNYLVNPHNGLLHIALGTGILPLTCFMIYMAKAVIGALRMMRTECGGEAAFIPPLVVFALIEIMTLDYAFMSPWVVVVFGLAARTGQMDSYQRRMTA